MTDHHGPGFATAVQADEPEHQAEGRCSDQEGADLRLQLIVNVSNKERSCFRKEVYSVSYRINDHVSTQRNRVIHEKNRD